MARHAGSFHGKSDDKVEENRKTKFYLPNLAQNVLINTIHEKKKRIHRFSQSSGFQILYGFIHVFDLTSQTNQTY